MALREIESTLPPGFRFHPSDEELVCYYLCKKVANERVSGVTLVDVNLHVLEPWELPDAARLSTNEWYFFSFRDRKYSSGFRANRATKTGYWKATGKDRPVYEPSAGGLAGMRKTLVFYGGRAPNGVKTGWVMHEFRLESTGEAPKEDWVLCRVFNKEREDTMREGLENRLDRNEFAFLHPSTSHGTTEEYPHQLALYSTHYRHRQDAAAGHSGFFSSSGLHSGFLDISPEMEAETVTPLRLESGGGGELEFLLDAKDLDIMSWET